MSTELSALLHEASNRLHQAGVSSPEFDSWALLCHVTGKARGELHAEALRDGFSLDAELHETFWALVDRRQSREPLWHITGRAPFGDLELEVGPGVFTPRPETELLAHQAIHDAQQFVPQQGELRVVDLCAGSGAIGIAIAAAIPYVSLVSVEISEPAAQYLSKNLERHVPERSQALVADVATLNHPWAGSVDLVVSNPPYLVPGDPLDKETSNFDPDQALFGGVDGLDVIRQVVDASRHLLRSGGVVAIEHGVDHGEQVRQLLTGGGFRLAHTEVDLLGRDRFTRATRA